MHTLVPTIFLFSKITIIIMFCALSTVGVKALKDCGVQTADVDCFSNPQGKNFLLTTKCFYVYSSSSTWLLLGRVYVYMYTSHGFHRCECLYKFSPVDLYCEIFCFVLLFAHPPIEVSGFYRKLHMNYHFSFSIYGSLHWQRT